MNNYIAALDSLSMAFLVAALACIAANSTSILGKGARFSVTATILTMLFRDASNILQWTGASNLFDSYLEDFVEILIPLFSGFFLYSYLQEKMMVALSSALDERQRILDSLTESMMFISRDLIIQWTNKAAEELFHKSSREMIGKKCHQILHNTDDPCEDCPVRKCVTTCRPETTEITTYENNILSMTAHPVVGRNGKIDGALESIMDITPRKKMEQRLSTASRMEAIGKLAGGVAHDFNNILTAIIGFAECGLEEINEQEDDRDKELANNFKPLFENILDSSHRAAKLTQQLLVFGRRQTLHPRIVDLNDAVNGTINMLGRMIGEDVNLSVDLAEGRIPVSADLTRLEQVIMNLAVNARDAMPRGGKLEIRTEVTEAVRETEDTTEIPGLPILCACLSIQDTGRGMSPDVLSKLFDPFFTTKSNGTGLGLSVTYGIIKQHNGWISVYSERNKGSVFKVYLPLAREVESVSNPMLKIPENVQLDGRGMGILIIEDETRILDFVSTSLARKNFRVFTATTCDQGRQVFSTIQEECSIILSDVVLPDGSGLDLAEELLKLKPDVAIILSSGYTEEKIGFERIRSNGFAYLPKPYPLTKLISTISEVMNNAIINLQTRINSKGLEQNED